MQGKIDGDINEALKKGDRPKAEALRLLKSALINARIATGRELTDEEAIRVIRKEIKSRIEARDLYATNDRAELAKKEEFERTTYAVYIPKELDQNELKSIITKVSQDLKDELSFSKLMPAVMEAVAGKADGRVVSELVKKYLEEQTK
jgi:hypothetical protein